MSYEELIKRYNDEEKIKDGYYLRIREEQGIKELNIYYLGFEIFKLNKYGMIIVNAKIFLPNTKNTIVSSKIDNSYEIIPEIVSKNVKKLFDVGFIFKIGNFKNKDLTLYYSKSEKLNERIKEKYFEDFSLKFDELDIIKKEKDNIITSLILKPSNENVFIINNIPDFQEKMYPFIFKLMKYTYEAENDDTKVFKQVDINPRFEIDINNLKEKDLKSIEEVLKYRTLIYAGIERNRFSNKEYGYAKGEDNQEKQVQQELLLEEKYKIIDFLKTTLPFEMEYTIYAGKTNTNNKDEKRNKHNIKGRIDNIYFECSDNSVYLVELKYGTKAINGTNGIHKHLIDIYTCLEENTKGIKQELTNYINLRNKELKLFDGSFECKSIEYHIICVYEKNKKNDVINAIAEFKDKSAIKVASINEKKISENGSVNKYKREIVEKNMIKLLELLPKTEIYLLERNNGNYNCLKPITKYIIENRLEELYE